VFLIREVLTCNCLISVSDVSISEHFKGSTIHFGDRGSTVVRVLCYKSEGPIPDGVIGIFH